MVLLILIYSVFRWLNLYQAKYDNALTFFEKTIQGNAKNVQGLIGKLITLNACNITFLIF